MYNLVELFSGIGSQVKALKNIEMDINVIGTCEWDIQAFCAYDAIHNSTEILDEISNLTKKEVFERLSKYTLSSNGKDAMDCKSLYSYSETILKKILTAIVRSNNYVDINELTGEKLPNNIDIMTYSFPCQDLSNVGAFHGYNKGIDRNSGSRSSLLWQVGRILNEVKDLDKSLPKFLLMENVPTLLSPRHINNFQEWIEVLKKLGYESHYYELNAYDFGLPQNRPRLLMISVFVGNDEKKKSIVEKFLDKKPDAIVNSYVKSSYYKRYKIEDLLRKDYDNPIILNEACACNPNRTESRKKIWEENPQIVLKSGMVNPNFDCIRTITTKQDRNPNSGNLYFDSKREGKSKFRYLTPRECLLFMGFTDDDYEKIIKDNPKHHGTTLFPRDKIIRMAGNSIPVKLLEGIFLQIKELDKLIKDYETTEN